MPMFMKLHQIEQSFVVSETVFYFPAHINAVLTLICKIVNKIRHAKRGHCFYYKLSQQRAVLGAVGANCMYS